MSDADFQDHLDNTLTYSQSALVKKPDPFNRRARAAALLPSFPGFNTETTRQACTIRLSDDPTRHTALDKLHERLLALVERFGTVSLVDDLQRLAVELSRMTDSLMGQASYFDYDAAWRAARDALPLTQPERA